MLIVTNIPNIKATTAGMITIIHNPEFIYIDIQGKHF
jgi:hypothetical protein